MQKNWQNSKNKKNYVFHEVRLNELENDLNELVPTHTLFFKQQQQQQQKLYEAKKWQETK